MSALPNLSALRLGQGPELDTGGRFTTYHGRRLGVRRTVGRFKTKTASGDERCAISLEDFKPGDPIWAGENGQYYYPWEYYRAARSNRWRDPMCGSTLPVTPKDQKRLAYLLRKVIPKRWPQYADEALRVLDDSLYAAPAAQPAFGEDDVIAYEEYVDSESEDVSIVPGNGRAGSHWNRDNYTWGDFYERFYEDPDDMSDPSNPWTPVLHARLLAQRSNAPEFMWSNPFANNGRLDIQWFATEHSSRVATQFTSKEGTFILTMPLVHGRQLTGLILGIGDPQWSLHRMSNHDELPDTVTPGSPQHLRRTVLKALLLGNRMAGVPGSTAYRPDERFLNNLEGKLRHIDFHVELSDAWQYIELNVYVSVGFMHALLHNWDVIYHTGNSQRREVPRLPFPPRNADWGNFSDPARSCVPPGWWVEEEGTFMWATTALNNWQAARVRLVQTVNNLTMLALGFPADPGLTNYRMACERPLEYPNPEEIVLNSAITTHFLPERRTIRAAFANINEMEFKCSVPFWYGVNGDLFDEDEVDHESFEAVNGRYGRYITWPSRPRGV